MEPRADDRVDRTVAGEDSERLASFTWDVRDVKRKEARVRIVDQEPGGWSHVNVDRVTLADAPTQPPNPPAAAQVPPWPGVPPEKSLAAAADSE